MAKVETRKKTYSIAERRVPELIPVLGSQSARDVSHKPGGRLLLLTPALQLPPQSLRGLLPILLLGEVEQRHNWCGPTYKTKRVVGPCRLRAVLRSPSFSPPSYFILSASSGVENQRGQRGSTTHEPHRPTGDANTHKVDDLCDKLQRSSVGAWRYYHLRRRRSSYHAVHAWGDHLSRAKLTTRFDDRYAVVKFSKSGVSKKSQTEVPVFCR